MRKALKIISGIISSLLIILAISIVFIGIYSFKNNKPFMVFGYYFSVVGSESMEGKKEDNPINKGDFIIAKKYDSYEIFDDIVFLSTEETSKGLYIVHRLIEIKEDCYITHGINNPIDVIEQPLKENVVGKVIQSFSLLGLGNIVLSQRNLIFACFAILFIVYLINQVILIIKMYNKEKENEKIAKWKEEIRQEILENKNKEGN